MSPSTLVFPQGFPNAVTQMRREDVRVCNVEYKDFYFMVYISVLDVLDGIEVLGTKV